MSDNESPSDETPEIIELEVYSVNISQDKKEIIFGGANDTFSVIQVDTNEEIFTDGFSDSVVYANFTDTGVFVVSYAGEAVFYTKEYLREKEFTFGEEISLVKESESFFFIGMESGRLVIIKDKEIIFDLFPSSSEIIDIIKKQDSLLVLTIDTLFIFQFSCYDYPKEKRRFPLSSAKSFSILNKMICVAEENIISFFTEEKKVKEIQIKEAECILGMNSGFIVGGKFDHLLLVDYNYGVKKISLPGEGVTRMKIKNNLLCFTTTDGKFCYGDVNRMEVVESNVGCVFDFEVCDLFFVLGGEKGLCVEKLSWKE